MIDIKYLVDDLYPGRPNCDKTHLCAAVVLFVCACFQTQCDLAMADSSSIIAAMLAAHIFFTGIWSDGFTRVTNVVVTALLTGLGVLFSALHICMH